MSSISSFRMSSKPLKKILKRIGIGLGIAVILLVVAGEVLLQTGALTGLVRSYAAKYVDGTLQVGRVSGSLLSRFPKVRLCLDDVSITYPHDRFSYAPGCENITRFTCEGRGAEADTLLSLSSLDATVSWIDAVRGSITLPEVRLDAPRFFYHCYSDGVSNLSVFGAPAPEEPASGEEEAPEEETPPEEAEEPQETEEGSFRLPLNLRRVSITGRPHVVYTAAEDDFYIAADISCFEATTGGDGLLTLRLDGDVDLRSSGYDLLGARLEAEGHSSHRYVIGEDGVPVFDATVSLPRAGVFHEGMTAPGRLRFLLASRRDDKAMDLSVNDFLLHADGLHTELTAALEDLLGEDPLLRLDADTRACLDSLAYLVPQDMDIDGRGRLDFYLKGDARLSAIDPIRYPEAHLEANFHLDGIHLDDRTDSLLVRVPEGTVDIRTQGNRWDDSIPEGTQVLVARADLDSLTFRSGADLSVRGAGLMLAAQNSTLRYGADGPMGTFTPFMVFLKAGRLGYRDGNTMMAGLRDTRNSFRVCPDSLDYQIPRIDVTSRSGGIFFRQVDSRYAIRNADLVASAKLDAFREVRQRNAFRDSIHRAYPGVSRDSLRAIMRREMPEWLQTEEFRDADISIDLDESLMAYLRNWDLRGSARVGGGLMMSSRFPLATQLDTLSADFTFDRIDLLAAEVRTGLSRDSLKLRKELKAQGLTGPLDSLESHLALTGSLSGIRRALNHRGPYVLDLELESDGCNVDAIMSAFAVGEKTDMEALQGSVDAIGVEDEQYQQIVEVDTLVHGIPTMRMFVVPANIRANVVLDGRNIRYGDLDFKLLQSDVRLEQRILQTTVVARTTDKGDVYLDGFYATQSMEDMGAGINLSLVGVEADMLSGLYPGFFDSIPYAEDMSGNLECQFVGLSRFDTELNPILPSMNMVARLTGGSGNDTPGARRTLILKNDPELRHLAKRLLFRHKGETHIKELEASLLVAEGKMEFLPSIVDIDRYRLAIAGVHDLDPDEAFKYSISILRSPLLVPFGISIFGPDLDHLDWSLTWPKYWSSSSLPKLRTGEKISQAQGRLTDAIKYVFETGVAGAIAAGSPSGLIEAMKEEQNYIFTLEEEALPEEERERMRQMQESELEIPADQYIEDLLQALRIKVMSEPHPSQTTAKTHE